MALTSQMSKLNKISTRLSVDPIVPWGSVWRDRTLAESAFAWLPDSRLPSVAGPRTEIQSHPERCEHMHDEQVER